MSPIPSGRASRSASPGPNRPGRPTAPATPVGEDRTLVVHDDLDRPEVRAAAPERAASLRRLAADMADVATVLRVFVGSRKLVTTQRTEGAPTLRIEIAAEISDGVTMRAWTIASADPSRPGDAIDVELPVVTGIAACIAPDALDLRLLAPVVARAADVLERPGDHPSETEWSNAVRALILPLRDAAPAPDGMVRNADHLSRSPVSQGRTEIATHASWKPWVEPAHVHEPKPVDVPDAMILTMRGRTLSPTIEAVPTHLHHDATPDAVTVLRYLAAMERHPLWNTHRERTRRP